MEITPCVAQYEKKIKLRQKVKQCVFEPLSGYEKFARAEPKPTDEQVYNLVDKSFELWEKVAKNIKAVPPNYQYKAKTRQEKAVEAVELIGEVDARARWLRGFNVYQPRKDAHQPFIPKYTEARTKLSSSEEDQLKNMGRAIAQTSDRLDDAIKNNDRTHWAIYVDSFFSGAHSSEGDFFNLACNVPKAKRVELDQVIYDILGCLVGQAPSEKFRA